MERTCKHHFPYSLAAALFSWGFPGSSDSKESAYNTGNTSLIPGLGRSPGGGHGNPFQCSCLENPMDTVLGLFPKGSKSTGFSLKPATFFLSSYNLCLSAWLALFFSSLSLQLIPTSKTSALTRSTSLSHYLSSLLLLHSALPNHTTPCSQREHLKNTSDLMTPELLPHLE